MSLPPSIDARPTDLTAAVRAILDAPPDPGELRVEADGIPFVARTWGDPARPPLLLVHGITSSSDTFWRIGPALGTGLDRYDDLAEALRAIARANPTWAAGDVLAKAEALTEFDEPAVRAILTENGDWDGGLAALRDPGVTGIRVRLVRGEQPSGGLVPDAAAEAIGKVIGEANVFTIAGGAHSPMRNRVESTMVALLRALDAG